MAHVPKLQSTLLMKPIMAGVDWFPYQNEASEPNTQNLHTHTHTLNDHGNVGQQEGQGSVWEIEKAYCRA